MGRKVAIVCVTTAVAVAIALTLVFATATVETVLYVPHGAYLLEGTQYDAAGLAGALAERWPPKRFDSAPNRFVVDFGDADPQMAVFVELVAETMKRFSTHVRFSHAGVAYTQPFPVDSSLDLADVVMDLDGHPQRHDYRSFVTATLVPLRAETRGYALGPEKFEGYDEFFAALVREYPEFNGIGLTIEGWHGLRLSDYCTILDAARRAGVSFAFFGRPELAFSPRVIFRPRVLGPDWPFSKKGFEREILQAGDFPPAEPNIQGR